MTLASFFYCENCGAALDERARHCFSCGILLHVPTQETLLRKRYRILDQVGQGGFGAVYKAEDTWLNDRLVAIKDISLSKLTQQDRLAATDAFNREVLLLSGLTHPNLPHIYDHFTDAEHWYLVRDFIVGETLEEYVKTTHDGCLSLEEVLDIGLQLCEVLDYLHTREPPIIFRDLKPANVMRTPNGHLYLIDFGIARRFKPGQVKDTIPLGSPGYAAPEQYGRAQTTPRADIYSLGAMLHHLLTGNDPAQTPFRFASVQGQALALPDRLQPLLHQMVDMDANKRPVSVATVRQELAVMTDDSPPLGTTLSTYRGHRGLVLAAAWSPDGAYLASGASEGTMHVWEVATNGSAFIYHRPSRPFAWVWALAWSPDGTYLASGGDDRIVNVWHVEKEAPIIGLKPMLAYQGHSNWVNTVAWSFDGKWIASSSDDMTVQVWQRECVEPVNCVYRGHSRWVIAAAWSPDSTRIASGSNDALIHIWDVATRETILIYRGHRFGINALAWSPDGQRIVSCSWDNAVHVWEAITGKLLVTYSCHTRGVNAVAWSPDGTRIASASKDKTVQIWDAISGRTLCTYRGHSGWVYALAWSPDGTRIASGGNDKTIQIWQAC
ncbi:MAG: protein kinase [Chloroflexi bacterium]|nr:protein kinase [Chloroflexota bacterium]